MVVGPGPIVGPRVPHRRGLRPTCSSMSHRLWLVRRHRFRRHPIMWWWFRPRPVLVAAGPMQTVELAPSVHAAANRTPSSRAPVAVRLEPTVCVGTPQLPSPVVSPSSFCSLHEVEDEYLSLKVWLHIAKVFRSLSLEELSTASFMLSRFSRCS
jgi:hypothetical protein